MNNKIKQLLREGLLKEDALGKSYNTWSRFTY
jgi:hypothetical protein